MFGDMSEGRESTRFCRRLICRKGSAEVSKVFEEDRDSRRLSKKVSRGSVAFKLSQAVEQARVL
jgi:hypothetical protein